MNSEAEYGAIVQADPGKATVRDLVAPPGDTSSMPVALPPVDKSDMPIASVPSLA